MKETMKLALLVCLALLACALMFTACDSGNDSQVHVHSYTEWTITKAATCTTNGIKERDCSCGDIQTVEIPATGEHQYGEWIITKAATCTEGGAQERVCTCGEKETKNISVAGHPFGAWVTTKDVTCTENGVQERVCTCGEKETKDISATGHIWNSATCIEPAKCSTCKASNGEALGHTCTVGKCTRCNTTIYPKVNIPSTPITTSLLRADGKVSTTMKITDLSYSWDDNGELTISYVGEKIFGNDGIRIVFGYRIIDKDGFVTTCGERSRDQLNVGDKFKGTFTISSLNSSSEYTIVFTDY